uniref:Uncharacterized protein n=1 Tax=Arundo donax TaxID=35708 RepID=A0A0A8ZJS6_ARUDO
MAHFIPLARTYTIHLVTWDFFDDIVRLHTVPVSNRDPVFTSGFWSELFRLVGVMLNLNSAFQP